MCRANVAKCKLHVSTFKHTYIMSQNRRRNNDIFISIYTQAYNFTTSLRNKETNIKISENVESVHTYESK